MLCTPHAVLVGQHAARDASVRQCVYTRVCVCVLCVQVHHPIDYARVVQRIGNEMDLTQVDLDDLLPAATVMVCVCVCVCVCVYVCVCATMW